MMPFIHLELVVHGACFWGAKLDSTCQAHFTN